MARASIARKSVRFRHPMVGRAMALAVTGLLAAGPVRAATRTWANTGADYNTAGNWTGGVLPGAADDVQFGSAAPSAQPSLSSNITNLQARFTTGAGGWTLSSTGGALSLTSTGNTNAAGTGAALVSLNSSGTNTVSAPLVLAGGSGSSQYVRQATGGTLVLAGDISEVTGSPVKLFVYDSDTGSCGTVRILGNNSFSGGFALSASSNWGGTVQAGHDNAFGTGTLTLNQSVNLEAYGGARVFPNPFTGSGNTLTTRGSNSITFAGSATSTGNLTWNNTLSGGAKLTFQNPSISNSYHSGTGDTEFILTGGKTLHFWGSTNSGTTTVTNSGTNTLSLNSVSAPYYGINSPTAVWNLQGSGTINFTRVYVTQGRINLGTGANAITLAQNGDSFRLGSPATPAGGTQILDLGDSLLANNIVLYANGTVGGGATIMSSGTGSILLSGGSLVVFQVYDSPNAANDLTISANIAESGAARSFQIGWTSNYTPGTVLLSGTNTYTGGNQVNGATLATPLLANGGSPSGIGQSSNAAGSLTLNSGWLKYTGPTVSTDRRFTISGTTTGFAGGLDASGAGAVTWTNTSSPAWGTAGQTRVFKLGGTNTDANTLAANIGNNGAGAVSLTKEGPGRWVLTGTSSYTGATLISDGTLALDGSGAINTSSGITVNGAGARFLTNSSVAVTAPLTLTQGTIGGTGAINSAVSIGPSVILSPGASPGGQTYADLTWPGGGTYLWEINSATGTAGADPGWDLVNAATFALSATSGNPFTIDVTSLTLANAAGAAANFTNTQAYYWKLLDTGVSLTASFAANKFVVDPAGFANPLLADSQFSVVLGTDAPGGDDTEIWLKYAYTPVTIPEPAAVTLLAVLAALAALGRSPRHVATGTNLENRRATAGR